ncbi:MAG: class I adenylate cyclase [Thermodesulfobacteriota bacterium]|nr:class I adenylate cyclase [Thermodesulfobacteriota bacterium]
MKKKIDRFLKYNKNRKIKAIIFDEARATLLFKIIPFLLHSNYPDLPGFINDDDCPFGIHLFRPQEIVSPGIFHRYFPTSTAMRTETPSGFTRSPCIHSLKTIGSIGTIAQTEKSDCDYWVSVRYEDLGQRGLSLLEMKCKAIQEWAMNEHRTEVFFFLMDIDRTRENQFESAAEEESAGSSLKILLKDELFRTHILVAGKMLLWWLIPPGLTEEEYRKYVQGLIKTRKINPDLFVDLGYLSDIPKSEIFGACLWQMNKALDSPFKSVIKFAYLELLLKVKSQRLPLFSDNVKRLVSFPDKLRSEEYKKLDLANVDPYLLLAREIAAFYKGEDSEQKRDLLIRECLFLKTLEGMESQMKGPGKEDHLRNTMAIMEEWDLLPDNHKHFLQFRFWKLKDQLDFGAKVHDFLIATYKRLRWIFRTFENETDVTITERDVAVLGRKLFTFYQKKPHKIPYIRTLSRDAMVQKDITIHITRYEGTDYYYAFQGEYNTKSIKKHSDLIIKRETAPVPLFTWLLINGMLGKGTNLHMTKNFQSIALFDIQCLTEAILETFPKIHFAHISGEKLLQTETVIQAMAVVNFDKLPVKGSKTLNSTMITANSWGEYFVEDFTTLIQLKNCIRLLLTKHYVSRWNKNLEIFIPPQKEQRIIQQMLEQ